MRKALTDAVNNDHVLTTNPALQAKRPRKEISQPVVMWNAENLAAFLETTNRHRMHAYSQVAAYTGARRGELMNLRWSDVHLGDEPSIRLRGTVSVIEGRRVEGTTKGGRERTISIDSDTVGHLVRHRAEQEVEREVAGASWVDDDHVFRQEPACRCSRQSDGAHGQVVAATQPGASPLRRKPLPHIRLHDLRHLHATLLLKAGVPVHVVAHRLGHADPAITLRVYAHVLDDQANHAAAVFHRLGSRTLTPPIGDAPDRTPISMKHPHRCACATILKRTIRPARVSSGANVVTSMERCSEGTGSCGDLS